MKTIITVILAAIFGTGCYTQVKSSGDYWGYTGNHQRENEAVVPNQQDSAMYYDSTANDQRSRDDEGYSSDGVYDDNYYNAPNYDYYYAPYVSLSFGFGWHRPWWDFGYSSYYPYCGTYNPYWDWYYQPGFFSYGCIAPIYPYYNSYYRPFYHSFYGEHFGVYRNGFFTNGRVLNGSVRSGRINGGEVRGRSSIVSGNGSPSQVNSRSVNSSSIFGRANSVPLRSTGVTNTPQNSGRSGNMLNAPRNNPRLIPQNTGNVGHTAQRFAPGRGVVNPNVARAPRTFSGTARPSGTFHGNGFGYGGGGNRGGGGPGVYHGGNGGGYHSGGAGSSRGGNGGRGGSRSEGGGRGR